MPDFANVSSSHGPVITAAALPVLNKFSISPNPSLPKTDVGKMSLHT